MLRKKAFSKTIVLAIIFFSAAGHVISKTTNTPQSQADSDIKSAISFANSKYDSTGFKIAHDNKVCSIYVDRNDFKVCQIAADCLADDIKRVCGIKPAIVHNITGLGGSVIFVGTLGHSAAVDAFVSSGKLNVSDIAGQWETFALQVVDRPAAAVDSALVITGSDRRGTAFGVFHLSKQMGVSPWYFWADVPTAKHDTITFTTPRQQQGPPSVKYRGIFINDEDWGLQPWAAKTYSPEDGDLGPKAHKQIFELLLRLKANYIWPGMHPSTRAFNYFQDNKVVADDYAIVMGSSHCEPMLRNNVDEWHRWQPADGSERREWNWCGNEEQITEYWRQRVRENAAYENIYTVGMRGVHDGRMPCKGASNREKAQKLQDEVIPAQRQLLAEYVNPDPAKVPQLFCPYKEVLDLYNIGVQLPEDVTIVWPDDNHGYIRRLSNTAERSRSGNSGIYYHISYWGSPHDYLWLCSTPPSLVWEELSKAYAYGADRIWVINVGDIKPAEIVTNFAMRMGWNIDRWNSENLNQYLTDWADETFGPEYSKDIAAIMNEYYQLAQSRKPEHMGFGTIYPTTPNAEPGFSPIHHGDQTQQRIDRYLQIESKAKTILAQLPLAYKDAFYELVYYPVRGASLMNQKFLYAQKSRLYAQQGRTSANDYAAKALAAYDAIITETEYYNNTLCDAKWKYMMTWNPRKLPAFDKPEVANVEPSNVASMGVIVEGQTDVATQTPGPTNSLPEFNTAVDSKYFIDIFNKGDTSFDWSAATSAPWINITQTSGTVDLQQRIWVSVNPDKIPSGNINATVTITALDQIIPVNISVTNLRSHSKIDFTQVNGVVNIEAENFTSQSNSKTAKWTVIPQLGCSGSSMMVIPVTTASYDTESLDKSPALEYAVWLDESGQVPVAVYCLPTHAITNEHGLRYAISFDDAAPQIVDFDTKEWSAPWKINVLRGSSISSSTHTIEFTGKHILKIRMVDPGVVIDRIVIGNDPAGYVGGDETAVR